MYIHILCADAHHCPRKGAAATPFFNIIIAQVVSRLHYSQRKPFRAVCFVEELCLCMVNSHFQVYASLR